MDYWIICFSCDRFIFDRRRGLMPSLPRVLAAGMPDVDSLKNRLIKAGSFR